VAQGRPELQRVFDDAAKHARYLDGGFGIQKLEVEGDMAIEIVEFTWNRSLDGGPPTGPQKGHALAIWQRQPDGTWLLRAWSAKYDPKS
jgi:ketosteroid isomerase-like protein